MQKGDDILKLLMEKGAEAAQKAHSGVILQPGAIGDCILTLPLVRFMKNCLGLGSVDILGHTEYIGVLPGRTCVDGIRSMDSVDLHRLFEETKTFDLADRDPLINVFADYAWIVTFLGEPDSDFEQNLIFTANCSHSAEVITLPIKPSKGFSGHITDFYIQQLVAQSGLSLEPRQSRPDETLIKPTQADVNRGQELLKEMDFDSSEKVVVIHPGSGSPKKCWHLDNFLAIAKYLASKDKNVVFLLGPAELDRFDRVSIKKITGVARHLTDLSLTQVLALLSCADAFVGNDSGITHLAASLGIRTVAVFGPTDSNVYRPVGPAVTTFTNRTAAFTRKTSVRLQKKLLKVVTA
ncbi:MAG: glycosyltransferase family 9 protein [Planctomycetota bacterium]|jgi:ADP-heptose:LPS heptosyltransferase